MGADLARAGEIEDLHQLDAAAPIGQCDLALERQRPEAELEGAARQADDGEVALEADDLGGKGEGVIGTDHVDHQLGAAAAGQLPDRLRRVLAGGDRLIGTDLAREGQLVGGGVDGDHLRRAECLEDLHGHVAEPADSDDHRRRARNEQPEGALHGVVGSESGVGEGRGVAGVEVAERKQQAAMWDQQVLGHAAVEAEPAAEGADLRLPLAVVLRRGAAGPAAPAAPGPVDRNRLALLEALDSGAERLDPSGVLVPEGEGKVEIHLPLRPLHQVKVRMTGAGAADLDQHLSRAGLGHLDVPKLRRLLPLRQLVGLHGFLPQCLTSRGAA